MVEMAAETGSPFVILTDSHYFQFVREMDKNIIVKYNLCSTPKELSTSRNSLALVSSSTLVILTVIVTYCIVP